MSSSMLGLTSILALEDPPPLEENVAKFVISTIQRVLEVLVQIEVVEAQKEKDERDKGKKEVDSPRGGSTPASGPGAATLAASTSAESSAAYRRAYALQTSQDLRKSIYKAIQKVVFYVSGSNWNVLYTEAKKKLAILSTTSDELADGHFRLLEYCNLNTSRLTTVLQGMCHHNGTDDFCILIKPL